MSAIQHPRRPLGDTDAEYLRRNLRLVTAGIKSRAPGIHRCTDCRDPWIADDSGLSWCRGCRVNHRRTCGHCHTSFTNTPDGDELCECCRNQHALFS